MPEEVPLYAMHSMALSTSRFGQRLSNPPCPDHSAATYRARLCQRTAGVGRVPLYSMHSHGLLTTLSGSDSDCQVRPVPQHGNQGHPFLGYHARTAVMGGSRIS
jgi:hypothetical protein